MNREDLIKKCRYYNGETFNPLKNDIRGIMWLAEFIFVDKFINNNESLWPYCDEYRNLGLLDFSNDDGVPVHIKALLFDRFSEFNGRKDVEAFKNFYLNSYLKKEA